MKKKWDAKEWMQKTPSPPKIQPGPVHQKHRVAKRTPQYFNTKGPVKAAKPLDAHVKAHEAGTRTEAAKQGAKDFLRGVDAYQPLPELPAAPEVAPMKGPGDDWTTAVEIMKSLWPKRPRSA